MQRVNGCSICYVINKYLLQFVNSQCLTIENLEARCEELQRKIDEINEQHESLLRQQTASQSTNTAQTQTFLWKVPVTQGGSIQQVINIHRIRFCMILDKFR